MQKFEFEYKCENCGACCRNWNPASYDSTICDENGVCKYLDQNTNLCTIYETRPVFCRCDEMFNLQNEMNYEEYIKVMKICCDALIQLNNLNK